MENLLELESEKSRRNHGSCGVLAKQKDKGLSSV